MQCEFVCGYLHILWGLIYYQYMKSEQKTIKYDLTRSKQSAGFVANEAFKEKMHSEQSILYTPRFSEKTETIVQGRLEANAIIADAKIVANDIIDEANQISSKADKLLVQAKESAGEIIELAKSQAEQILSDASKEYDQIIEDSMLERDKLVQAIQQMRDEIVNIQPQHDEIVRKYKDEYDEILRKHQDEVELLRSDLEDKKTHYSNLTKEIEVQHQRIISEVQKEQSSVNMYLHNAQLELTRINKEIHAMSIESSHAEKRMKENIKQHADTQIHLYKSEKELKDNLIEIDKLKSTIFSMKANSKLSILASFLVEKFSKKEVNNSSKVANKFETLSQTRQTVTIADSERDMDLF